MEEEKKDKKTAEFNESMLQILRLNDLWKEIARFRQKGELDKAKWGLDSAETELTEDAEDFDEKNDFIEKLENINNKIKNTKSLVSLYKYLLEKEKLLRKIQTQFKKKKFLIT